MQHHNTNSNNFNKRQSKAKDREFPRYVNEVSAHNIKKANDPYKFLSTYNVAVAASLLGDKNAYCMVSGNMCANKPPQTSFRELLKMTDRKFTDDWKLDRILDFPATADFYRQLITLSDDEVIGAVVGEDLYYCNLKTPGDSTTSDVIQSQIRVDHSQFRTIKFHPKGLILCDPHYKLVDRTTDSIVGTIASVPEAFKYRKCGISWPKASPDALYLSSGQEIYVRDLRAHRTGSLEEVYHDVSTGPIISMDYNSDMHTVAAGTELGMIMTWDIRQMGRLSFVKQLHESSNMVKWSSREKRLYVGTGKDDERVRIWDFCSSTPTEVKVIPMRKRVTSVLELSSDPRYWIFSARNGGLWVYDSNNGGLSMFGNEDKSVSETHQSVCGNILVSLTDEETIRINRKPVSVKNKNSTRSILRELR